MKRTPRTISRLRQLKGQWRDQVYSDHQLHFSTRVVGYHMADCITMDQTLKEFRTSGKVIIWPSQEYLQEHAGANRDTVRRSVAQLIERGHLKLLRRGNQATGSNQYRVMLFKKERDA